MTGINDHLQNRASYHFFNEIKGFEVDHYVPYTFFTWVMKTAIFEPTILIRKIDIS